MRSVMSSTLIVFVRLLWGTIWNMRDGFKGSASEKVLEFVADSD